MREAEGRQNHVFVHGVKSDFRAGTAVKPGRMSRRRRDPSDVAAAQRLRIGRRFYQMTEAVERFGHRQDHRGVARELAGPRAARQVEQPMEHIDVQARQRQRRPGGIGGDVKQDDPAFAALGAGDERRAVGEPRPGPFREFDGRLGEDLPRHRDFRRHGEAPKRTSFGKRRDVLRLAPGKRAAEIAPAYPQLHRYEIVDRRRHAVAGEADKDAALLDELRDAIVIGAGDGTDVSEHKCGHVARERIADRAFLYVCIGREGAAEIPHLRQQRLFVFGIARRNDLHGAPAFSAAKKLHGPGGIDVFDRDASGVVADF